MSWPQWQGAAAPGVQQTLPGVVNPAASIINPAPPVVAPGLQYTPDQWAQMQQQNWQQWAQWQQQYQQWHQQYGAEYQKSISALSTTLPPQPVQHTMPALPNVGVPPPLPVENKPPLPLDDPPPNTNQPPPSVKPPTTKPPSLLDIQTQPPPQFQQQQQQQQQMYSTGNKISNYTTVSPAKNANNTITNFSQKMNQNRNNNWSNQQNNSGSRFSNDNKRQSDGGGGNDKKRFMNEQWQNQPPQPQQQQQQQPSVNTNQKPIVKELNLEQITEAEKKFDKQFADWEAQFNKWKEQNAEHPDKDQYREYEKKWELWRSQLLDRREQMKRKRLSLTTANTSNSNNAINNNTMNNNNQFRQPNFTQQPPPLISSSRIQDNQLTKNINYNKPPPNMNNEPLKFKENEPFIDNSIETEDSKENNELFKPVDNNEGGIPGLDLVKEEQKPGIDDVVIIDKENENNQNNSNNKGLDLDAISKGINTILGDEKLLSMLSMVSSQNLNVKANDSIIDSCSKIKAIDKMTLSNVNDNNNCFNEQSNLSHDEKSNQSDYYSNNNNQSRELINNFDDQTRSSFTMGHNEIDMRYDNNNRNNNFDNNRGNLGNNDYYNNRNNFNNRNNNFDYNNERQFVNFKDNNCDNFNRQNQFNTNNANNNTSNNNKRNFNSHGNFNSVNDDNYDHMNDYYKNTYDNMRQDYQDNNDKNFNFQRGGDNFNEYNNEQNSEQIPKQQVAKDNDILKPATVVDYDHKPVKPPEPEVLIEPIRMFDYRHKQLNRIPFPQRPKWLSEEVKNIREFDPPIVRPYELSTNLRRYPKDSYQDHRSYDDRWSNYGTSSGVTRRNYNEMNQSFDHRRQPPPLFERKLFDDDWSNDGDNIIKREENYDRFSNENKRFNERRQFSENRNNDNSSNNKSNYDDRKPIESFKEDNAKLYEDIDDYEDTNSQDENNETCLWQNRSKEDINERLKFEKPVDLGNGKNEYSTHVTMIEDIINVPGRYKRPPRIVIILRGPPGSGKTFLAKLIKDKEVENGGSPPRILSLDDYFMVEQEKEITEDGKRVKIKEMIYEYEANMEESYRMSLVKSFKKTITDGYFPFIIVDNVNDKVKYFGEMWSYAKQNGFQVYICQLELDVQTCTKRNIHNRTEKEIQECVDAWEPTPSHHPTLDATSLIQSGSIPEVEMEEINSPDTSEEFNEHRSEDQVFRSKWDNFDCSIDNLAKLDGIHKPIRHHGSRTMEEYLQMECEWNPVGSKPGQKRVRWADLEEQREQKKMRALGFVVGQTNWDRIMDTSMGSSALTQTKYFDKTGYY